MRHIRYWKAIQLPGTNITMELVPPQELSEPHIAFDAVVAAVKQSGFSYVITETTERVLDGSTQGDGAFPNRRRARIDEIQAS